MAFGEVVDFGPASGAVFGRDVNAKIGFYGTTPIVQRGGAIQASSFISVSSNATIGATLAAFLAEVATTLQLLGLWKGAA